MEGSESQGNQDEAESSNSRKELLEIYAKVIKSDNDALKIRSAIKLAKMSRHASMKMLALAVPILLEYLKNPSSNSIRSLQEAAAYCLKCIASRGEGILAGVIGQSGGIPILLTRLPNSEDRLQRDLLKCLRNIVTCYSPNREILASNGGLEIVISMLSSCPDNSKLILLEILSALSLVKEVRKSLWETRRVDLLVQAAGCGGLVSRTRAAQAIGLLGRITRSCHVLLDSGAVPVLMRLLNEGDLMTKLVAGNALGVISSHVTHIRPVARAGAIPLYADLLRGPDPTGKEIAEDMFCLLGVHEESAVTILEHLVGILREGDAGAKAAAAAVIWDLSGNEYSFPVVRSSGAIPILAELLKDESLDVRERVSGAVAQLSHDEADRAVLASCGAIPFLIEMLEDGECDEVKDNAMVALVNFSLDPLFGDQLSCIADNPSIRDMRGRIMQTLL